MKCPVCRSALRLGIGQEVRCEKGHAYAVHWSEFTGKRKLILTAEPDGRSGHHRGDAFEVPPEELFAA